MKTYRLAIVGLGRMGSTIDAEVEGYPSITLPYSIAASAKAIARLELVAGCDIMPAKTEAFSKKWGVSRTYTDYQKMLATEKPEMVAICTPGPLHAAMTIAAAEAGATMIYCEKAMACSMQEADAVRAAIATRHIAFNTGVLRRFRPALSPGPSTDPARKNRPASRYRAFCVRQSAARAYPLCGYHPRSTPYPTA